MFSDHSLRAFAGNSMPLCVIEPLLRKYLIAAGSDGSCLPDRWATGVAQADLVKDAFGPVVPTEILACVPPFVAQHLVGLFPQ